MMWNKSALPANLHIENPYIYKLVCPQRLKNKGNLYYLRIYEKGKKLMLFFGSKK